jgi:predicted DsbA family dithiol-disulfide isomerase
MNVDIWSDVVCPFCYIGKRKFESALSKFSHKEDIHIIWHSFQLSPDMEYTAGKSLNEWLAEKKGLTVQEAKQMNDHVSNLAAGTGLTFNFDIAKPANTFNAHRLIHFAAKFKLQDKAKERLLSAYFTEGLNVSDKDTLIQLGGEIGLDKKELEAMFDSDDMKYEVQSDIQEAEDNGIRGVPFFVFNRKYAISGAQSPEIFLAALNKAWGEWKQESPLVNLPSEEGESCTRGENC